MLTITVTTKRENTNVKFFHESSIEARNYSERISKQRAGSQGLVSQERAISDDGLVMTETVVWQSPAFEREHEHVNRSLFAAVNAFRDEYNLNNSITTSMSKVES